jgi:hypothetical protein
MLIAASMICCLLAGSYIPQYLVAAAEAMNDLSLVATADRQ